MAGVVPKYVCPQAASLLNAGLGSQVLLPSDAEYTAREDSYWSNDAKLKPACIVRPRSAEEVSVALKALVAAGEKFAVRSGGHTNWAGSNNIADGVTIDLGLMAHTHVDMASETASIGPGGRWREVYAELHKHGRIVAGGREGNVGVAGLILGGGNTFLTARRGFACDNVVEFEVVLADGRIVRAGRDENSDLYRALKGGSVNFGIVTDFKMRTVECDRVWGGMTFFSKDHIPAFIEAVRDFTANIARYPDDNLVTMFTYAPNFKDIVVATLYVSMSGTEKGPAFEKMLAIPEIVNTVKMTSVAEMAVEYDVPAQYYNIWFTMSFKNDTRIMTKASDLHNDLVEDLKDLVPDGNFITQCLYQPLPLIFAENSARAGGNVMGMERHKSDGVLLLATASFPTAEQRAQAYPKVQAWIRSLKQFAETIEGGLLEWTYLNYADESQDVLASYGEDNVKFMREVAAKYDPQQVFQTLCPGGFKISKV